MSLEQQIRDILNNFDDTSSEIFLQVLDQVKPHFKSNLTLEYVQGKIQKVNGVTGESEKKKQCKALIPYLDWYLQGI